MRRSRERRGVALTESSARYGPETGQNAAGGIALVVIGSQCDWGFVSLFWSGVLAVFALAGLFGRTRRRFCECPECEAGMAGAHAARYGD
ncbi:MAG TPA: hypothetical protein ENJ18_04525 [Nannocystis exedens]|nr:hypothetical protein [Nannocystis exedens]